MCWLMLAGLEFKRLKAMIFEASRGYKMNSKTTRDRVRSCKTKQNKKLTWNIVKIMQIKYLRTITTVMPTICLVSRSKTKNLNTDFNGKLNYVFHKLPTRHNPHEPIRSFCSFLWVSLTQVIKLTVSLQGTRGRC